MRSARSPCGLVSAFFPLRVVLFLTLFAWILYARVDMRLVFQWRESLFLWNFHYSGQVPGSARRFDGMDGPVVGAVVLLGLARGARRDCRRVAASAGDDRSDERHGLA